MTSFEKAAAFVLGHEGGYVNDPNDAGGETNLGISAKSYPDIDIKTLTRERAIEIYHADYWTRCKCGYLPAPIAFLLFDAAVNQGPAAAVRMLQKSLKSVRVDGIIGHETLTAIENTPLRSIVCAFVARRAYQYALHPKVAHFGMGWFNRLAECHQRAQEES